MAEGDRTEWVEMPRFVLLPLADALNIARLLRHAAAQMESQVLTEAADTLVEAIVLSTEPTQN